MCAVATHPTAPGIPSNAKTDGRTFPEQHQRQFGRAARRSPAIFPFLADATPAVSGVFAEIYRLTKCTSRQMHGATDRPHLPQPEAAPPPPDADGHHPPFRTEPSRPAPQ